MPRKNTPTYFRRSIGAKEKSIIIFIKLFSLSLTKSVCSWQDFSDNSNICEQGQGTLGGAYPWPYPQILEKAENN